ncbi:MAG: hypothetical protein AAGC53_18785 [Actinomycetota bacterium]
MTMTRHLASTVATIAVSLLAMSCSSGVDVSRDEAVELLVLDGVPRERAVCIVDGINGEVSLAKITGVDPDMSDDELTSLATASSACVVLDPSTGVIGTGPAIDPDLSEGGELALDIDAEIERLIVGGIERSVGECVRAALYATPDPIAALESDNFVSEALRICNR